MHDVDRNSLLYKDWETKKKLHGVRPETDTEDHDHHSHHHDHGHDHHGDTHVHSHDHSHSDAAYHHHDEDTHDHHHHSDRANRDRVYTHAHKHKHVFYHSHHHTHDPHSRNVLHKIFKDPVRDWFAVIVMTLLILSGGLQWLPGHLADGALVCAAMIGIFPPLKNALFQSIFQRKPTVELFISLVLIATLLTGHILEASLLALFMLLGSFIKLDFSWRS